MISFAIFVAGVIGMTSIVVDGLIFNWARSLLKSILPTSVYEGIECHQCMGFWCGLLMGWVMLSQDPWVIFAAGCAGSFLASWSNLLFELVISKTDFTLDVPPVGEDTNE